MRVRATRPRMLRSRASLDAVGPDHSTGARSSIVAGATSPLAETPSAGTAYQATGQAPATPINPQKALRARGTTDDRRSRARGFASHPDATPKATQPPPSREDQWTLRFARKSEARPHHLRAAAVYGHSQVTTANPTPTRGRN